MKKATKFLVALVAIVFFLPLISSAAELIPTGPQCYPDDDLTVDRACPYGPADYGSTGVQLEWDLGKAYTHPFCYLTCDRPGTDSCSPIIYKDEYGKASKNYPYNPVHNAIEFFSNYNLKPKDSIFIPQKGLDLATGNTYKVVCCEKKDQYLACGPNPNTFSPKMTIVPSVARCERSFSSVMADLTNMRHTIITEESFRDWANVDERDSVSTSTQYLPSAKGSGDVENIKEEMSVRQYCAMMNYDEIISRRSEEDSGKFYFKKAIEKIKEITDQNRPVPLTIYGGYVGHSLIALDVEKKGEDEYLITAIDSNQPEKEIKIYCQKKMVIPYVFEPVGCEYTQMGGWVSDDVIPIVFKNHLTNIMELGQLFDEYCSGVGGESKFCRERQNMTEWLKNNYPQIKNFGSSSSPEGICAGWSNFVLSVAYLGEFTGFDWHPDDGCGVGYACDTNRDSLDEHQTTSALPSTSWLANLSQLTKFINFPGLIGWPVR